MVSVIVCTYNRAHRLKRTLHSLRGMKAPVDLPWELIIVDNNSSDHTKEVVESFINSSAVVNVKYIIARQQGISYARNMGIQEASGNIIAFTDDDCIVDQYWITSISKEFHSDKSIAGIGGRVLLYNNMDRPVSIRLYEARTVVSSINGIFKLMIGCNMAFAKPIFDEVGIFDTDFGAGSKFASTEDLDFLYRVYKKGLKIIYSPDVLVYHNHGRKNDEQINSLFKGYGIGRGAFFCKYTLMGDRDVVRFAYSEISFLIKGMIKRFIKGELSTRQRLFFTSILLGFISRLVRIKSLLNNGIKR